MSKKILLIPDPHATVGVTNERAEWLAQLIIDTKPDIVVNGGDQFDMPSISSYDKGKRSFHGRTYKDDIEVGLDFHERLWGPVKATKKKTPYRIALIGNHEQRVERALDLSEELIGTIGMRDYDFESYYHTVVPYDGGLPGIIEIEGILMGHYFPTGISGRPLGGERPASMLLNKNKTSCVAFHSHTLDFATQRTVKGQVLNGLVAGCFHDHIPDWAGPVGKFWRPGVAILNNAEAGNYDFQWISLESLRKEYLK